LLDGMSGIEISDVFGLSKPLSKLINVASAACGKVYESKGRRFESCRGHH